MSPSRQGLAWVWRDPAADAELTITVPAPQGATYTVDVTDPWTPLAWELPPGVDALVFTGVFGQQWCTRVHAALQSQSPGPIPVPPRVPDGWARVAVVRALRGNGAVTLHEEVLAVDEALAWEWAGQDEMALLQMEKSGPALRDLIEQANVGLMPLACVEDVRAACELAARLGRPVAESETIAGRDLHERVDARTTADLTGTPQIGVVARWVLGRLAGAAVASGGSDLVEDLRVTGGAVPPPMSALRPSIAEVLVVHDLPSGLDEDPYPQGQRIGTFDLAAVAPAGPTSLTREQVLAALDVYRSFDLPDRVEQCEALLARFDQQGDERADELAAVDVADLHDLDHVVAGWVFDLAVADLTRALPVAQVRGADVEPPAEVRVVLYDDSLFADLMGRTRAASTDGWATLTVAMAGHTLSADLWLPGEPVDPVAALEVLVPTSAGAVPVTLTSVDSLQLSGTAKVAAGVKVTAGSVTVRKVRREP